MFFKVGIFLKRVSLSYELLDKYIAEDIWDSQDQKLLLAKGKKLTVKDITLLINHRIKEICINDLIDNNSNRTIEDQAFDEAYKQNLDDVKSIFDSIETEEVAGKIESVLDNYTSFLEMALGRSHFLYTLHSMKNYDEYTYRHSLNVSVISAIIGKLMGLTLEETTILGHAGMLHDIGKIKISKNIINKQGPLNQTEFEIVKKHTIYGYEILRDIDYLDEVIKQCALSHHERLDGEGYPHALNGESIPFFAQIIAVADTYDAICSNRVYQPKESPYLAIQALIQGMYQQKYNAEVVTKFVHYLLSGYVGHEVLLNDGSKGKIILVSPEELDRPLIKVNDYFVNLREQRDLVIKDILS